MFEIGKEPLAMSLQSVSRLGEVLEAQGLGLVNPGVQEGSSEFFIGQTPKGAKVLFQEVGGVERFIDLHEHHEPFKGTGFEIFECSEQEEAAALDDLFVLTAELTSQISSCFIDSPVDDGHDMVRVMDNVHMRKHLTDGLHVGGGHIHGHSLDFGLLALELLKKGDQGIGIFALMSMEDFASFKIEHHGHVVMPFADGELIHREVSNLVQFSPSEPV